MEGNYDLEVAAVVYVYFNYYFCNFIRSRSKITIKHSLYGGINMYVGHSLFCLHILILKVPLFIEEVHCMVIFHLFQIRNGAYNVGQRGFTGS